MTETRQTFDNRLGNIGRKHAAMTKGYKTIVQADGLILVTPKRTTRHGFPIKGLLTLIVCFFVFKAVALASIGEPGYNDRISRLQQGAYLEQFVSWAMRIDAPTRMIAKFIDPYVK